MLVHSGRVSPLFAPQKGYVAQELLICLRVYRLMSDKRRTRVNESKERSSYETLDTFETMPNPKETMRI